MSFQMVGEVIIDGRKGTIALKSLQNEATKTSETFRRAGHSTEKLGKSLLQLGLHSGRAEAALHALHRLGTGGLIGAAALAAINKFGETIKEAAKNYYESQKELSDAFETSFKSKSVEEAQKGLEKTEDTIESLRNKITQFGKLSGFLKGMEKLTGISFGVGDTEKALKVAENNLSVQEQVVKARMKERDVLKGTEDSIKTLERISAINKIDIKTESLKGNILDENVLLAEEELKTLNTTTIALENQLKELDSITDAKKNQEAIDRTLDILADNRVKKAQAEYNLAKASNDANAKRSKQAQEAGGGLLGASRAGQQALDVARKVRSREVKKEDFRTQDQVFEKMKTDENAKRKRQGLPPVTSQQMREKVASQQAAGEMPLLSEKLTAGQIGTPASQIAAEKAKGGGGKDVQDQLLKAIEALTKKLPAAVAQ